MSDFKSSEREFANITLASVMAAFPQLGIDMSIAARLSGHVLKNMISQYLKPFMKTEPSIKAILDKFSALTTEFAHGASYEYSNLTDTSFDLEIKNCYLSLSRQFLERMNINPPMCMAFGITAAIIEDLTGKVVSIKESTYDPKTNTCKHKMIIE